MRSPILIALQELFHILVVHQVPEENSVLSRYVIVGTIEVLNVAADQAAAHHTNT